MKKTIVSFVFVLSFAVYAIYDRLTTAAVPTENVATAVSQTATAASVAKANATPSSAPSGQTNNSAPSAVAVSTSAPVGQTVVSKKKYNDGTYVGVSADAYYGNVQVQLTIANDKITNIAFLDYPQDRGTSVRINSQAMPMLTQEAIAAQSANINGVSGASDTSEAFRQSLSSALSKALA